MFTGSVTQSQGKKWKVRWEKKKREMKYFDKFISSEFEVLSFSIYSSLALAARTYTFTTRRETTEKIKKKNIRKKGEQKVDRAEFHDKRQSWQKGGGGSWDKKICSILSAKILIFLTRTYSCFLTNYSFSTKKKGAKIWRLADMVLVRKRKSE